MINYILSKLGAKAILYICLGSLGLNTGQFIYTKYFRQGDYSQEFIDLAISESHAQRDLLQQKQLLNSASLEVAKAHALNNTLSDISERREKRRHEWHLEALMWKNKYNEERCDEDDEICKEWGSASYRGDG